MKGFVGDDARLSMSKPITFERDGVTWHMCIVEDRERPVHVSVDVRPAVDADLRAAGYAPTDEARLDVLREAVAKHRQDLWGDGRVEHPADVELYSLSDSLE